MNFTIYADLIMLETKTIVYVSCVIKKCHNIFSHHVKIFNLPYFKLQGYKMYGRQCIYCYFLSFVTFAYYVYSCARKRTKTNFNSENSCASIFWEFEETKIS